MQRITKFALMALLPCIAACSIQQENGQDLRLEPPPLVARSHWHITQQVTLPGGDRVCTVSAGELDVTQRSHRHVVSQQVALANTLDPGDSYTVVMGDHNYETMEGQFDPEESSDIIKYMLVNPVVYTEVNKRTMDLTRSSATRRMANKIDLSDFSRKFNECGRFVH